MSKSIFTIVLVSSVVLTLSQSIFAGLVTAAVGFYIRHKLSGLNLGVR